MNNKLIDFDDLPMAEPIGYHGRIMAEKDTEAIFCDDVPSFPIAYFTGPWLPMSYTDELSMYSGSLDYPLQILEQPARRNKIVDVMTKISNNGRSDFFTTPEIEISTLFDQLQQIKSSGKPLYNQWVHKINGKERNLSVPKSPLEKLLRDHIMDVIKLSPCHTGCHGGEEGWSVKRSLLQHIPLGSVLSFDLQQAFDRVDMQYVFDFYYRIFETRVKDEDARRDVSGFLTHLSTVYKMGLAASVLPQGSPISVPLFNRLLYSVDELFEERAKKKNLRYTRWVDDFILSAREKDRRFDKVAGALRIVNEDFYIAPNKVFWQQNLPVYYLLNHKIVGNLVIPVTREEAKNRGEPIDASLFLPDRLTGFDDWIDDEDLDNF
ncbi:MAG: reverse transcriptase domain-containing protein [Nanoarchaeota archaeon]